MLLVFFLAGYFARRWEWLRELRQKTLIPRWLHWPEFPRFSHVLPVMTGVAVALLLFFVLKDLGPALVIGFLFLSMFAVARGRVRSGVTRYRAPGHRRLPLVIEWALRIPWWIAFHVALALGQ